MEELNVQTAEIARRFAGEPKFRPSYAELHLTLHGSQSIFTDFALPPEMKPIGYGGALAAPEDCQWLLRTAFAGRPKPALAVEIGTFVGSSAVRLGAAMRDADLGSLLCVDSFTGSGEMWFLERFRRDLQFQNGRPRIYELWMENIVRHNLINTVLPWCITSLAAAQCFRFLPWLIDFIFLDSAHLKGETYMEIAAFWDVLDGGGLLAGDDYDSFPAVKHDVDLFAQRSGLTVQFSPSGRLWSLRKPGAGS